MRRADRLFKITQLLSSDKVVTAKQLAASLEVSERTIYRDIQDLMLADVPILSEAGMGYQLMKGYRMPPLMFTSEELSALMLGARFIQASGDRGLGDAATAVIEKIGKVIPDRLQKELQKQELFALDFRITDEERMHMQQVRESIQRRNCILIQYEDQNQQPTERSIRPLGLFFWGQVWTAVAWCELRHDFRQFRIDRIRSLTISNRTFEHEEDKSITHYLNDYNCD
ncbi:helix-turn-helix transcriptional regulator [Marinicella sp. W31]|uniref:helix-turn-helix transcriptional regulator n=1 Tax=Marinicella sp. W31 TaxID=3023713 RepID=UPI0037566F96